MDYKETREYLDGINRFGSVLGLESIEALLDKLGNPQDKLRFVHIAGTNGKGSTLAFLSTILMCAGYRTGRYISPAVFSYREKIQVNGEYIDHQSLIRLTQRVKTACQQMEAEGKAHPTIFEVETALAFLYFEQEKCDIVVLETGLGGLLDATNIIKTTLVAALASISMDHMGILGNTLAEIAQQKAGIIKEGCHVVSMRQHPEAMAVVEHEAERKKATLVVADPAGLRNVKYGLKGQKFDYISAQGNLYEAMEITQAGTYQIENAMFAINVTEVLIKLGYNITKEALRQGLRDMRWPGRFSLINEAPIVILDGAHNEDGALKLAQSIKTYLKDCKIIGIMGVFADKEYEAIAEITVPLMEHIITIQTPDNVRALDAGQLMQTVKQYNKNCSCAESIDAAVNAAYQAADDYRKKGYVTAIVAYGSLSHLAELYRAFEKEK